MHCHYYIQDQYEFLYWAIYEGMMVGKATLSHQGFPYQAIYEGMMVGKATLSHPEFLQAYGTSDQQKVLDKQFEVNEFDNLYNYKC